MAELDDILSDKPNYWLGPILDVHYFAEFAFVEYNRRNFGTSARVHGELTNEAGFSIFANGQSISRGVNSLEDGVITAIAYKYDGCNSQAADFFRRMIGADVHKDFSRYANIEETSDAVAWS